MTITKVILITTGDRKKVLKDTITLSKMNERYPYDIEYTIVTDKKNIGIFSSISKLKIRLYEMNPANYLILKNKEFHILIDRANTELSSAFAQEIYFNCSTAMELITYDPSDITFLYYFEKVPIAIDQLHSIMKREGKFLIGINIGEDEHPTKKLPFSFIIDLMNKINRKCQAKFVILGTEDNLLRSQMIERVFPDKIINLISLVKNLKRDWPIVNPERFEVEILSQAIDLCDIFISLDSFYMHLSIAVKQNTLGLFANTSPALTENFENLIKKTISHDYEKECFPCNDTQNQCPVIYMSESEEHCLYFFNPEEIADAAVNILIEKNL